MTLDIRSKMLVIIDFVALLFLIRYLEYSLMWVPFILVLLMLWIWLFRLFHPLSFAWSALISILSAAALYVNDPYLRTSAIAIVVPAIGAAIATLVRPELKTGNTTSV